MDNFEINQTELYGPAGYSFDTSGEAVNLHLASQKRVDAIARNPYKADKPDAIDFTVGNALGQSYLSEDATLDPTLVTARLEKDKLEKHGDAARKLGMKLMPIAFTTFGGMGDVFLKQVALAGALSSRSSWIRSSRRAASVGRRASNSSAPSKSSRSFSPARTVQ